MILCPWDIPYLSTLVLILLSAYSTAAPTLSQSGRHDELSPATRDLSPIKYTHPNLPSLRRTTRDLHRRVWKIDYLDEGWALYFSVYDHFLSIENAAATLESFYSAIAEMATGPWMKEALRKELTITWGQLALDFKCDTMDIPWEFVAMVAQRMENCVRTGFKGAFEAYLEHLISGGMVYSMSSRS